MRKLIAAALFVCFISLDVCAQETPKPEVFGGYQYSHISTGHNLSGWNGAASLYINRWLGVTGDFSGVYPTGGSFYTYTFGPVVSIHKGIASPFVHGLFGGAHAADGGGVNRATKGAYSQSGYAVMLGGGVDVGYKKFALRLVQGDWLITHVSTTSDTGNIRISTGVLYRF